MPWSKECYTEAQTRIQADRPGWISVSSLIAIMSTQQVPIKTQTMGFRQPLDSWDHGCSSKEVKGVIW